MSTTLTRTRAGSPLNGDRSSRPTEPIGRRNNTRIALGLIVLVLCVLAAVTMYGRTNNRVDVLVMRRPVALGQRLNADDLGSVSISSDAGLRILATSERSTVIGQIATVGLLPGSLLSPSQISAGPAVPNGMVITGATLKSGQFPIGLEAGDQVLLVESAPGSATGSSADPTERGNARVLDIEQLKDANSSVAVSLVVPAAGATAVASAGADGRLTLVVVREP